MPSLRTSDCPHQWMRDAPGEPCIFCGLPKPDPAVVERVVQSIAKGLARSRDRRTFLAGRDPGDEG